MEVKIIGFVIKKQEFNFNDEIITLLCEDEIISFFSLGTRKLISKNAIALQLGNLVEAYIFKSRLNKKLSKLKKALLIFQPPIKKSDTSLVLVDILKLLKNITNTNKEFFNNLNNSFRYFGNNFNHHIKTYVKFILLKLHGYYPIGDKCVECNRKDRICGFEFYLGGFTCILHVVKKRRLLELKAFRKLFLGIDEYLSVDSSINQKINWELDNFLQENSLNIFNKNI